MLTLAQQTYVPDDDFEQHLINEGYDNVLDDFVQTSAIDTVSELHLGFFISNISDLTGIEDFALLKTLTISANLNLTTLDVSNNIALTYLTCYNNQLTSLDVTQNTLLQHLEVPYNQLNSLDVSQNTALEKIECQENNINNLDLSNNISLIQLDCENNGLLSLDLRNGNNYYITRINIETNFNLTCVNVDDSVYSINNWDGNGTNINGQSISAEFDPQHYYSNNCKGSTSIQEESFDKQHFIKVIDVLGKEVKGTKNELLFYIYHDGRVEKRIVIE